MKKTLLIVASLLTTVIVPAQDSTQKKDPLAGLKKLVAPKKDTMDGKVREQNIEWRFGEGLDRGRVIEIGSKFVIHTCRIPFAEGSFTLHNPADTLITKKIQRDSIMGSFGEIHITPEIQKRIAGIELRKAAENPDIRVVCDLKLHDTISDFFLIKRSTRDSAYCMRDTGTNRFDPSFTFGAGQTKVKKEILWKRFSIFLGVTALMLFLFLKKPSKKTNIIAQSLALIALVFVVGFGCLVVLYREIMDVGCVLDVPLWQSAVIIGSISAVAIGVLLKMRRVRREKLYQA